VSLDDLRSLVTVAAFVAFLGVIVWAYSRRRKRDFDEASQLPFADEPSDRARSDEDAPKVPK
jgi:cytochrome c oxidase cbb3-type subunit 4